MAQQTLQDILESVGAYVDQDTTLPTAGSTDETFRVNLVNQALEEWGNAYQWEQLRLTSSLAFALSSVSVALPGNFKKLMSPVVNVNKSTYDEYVELRPEDRHKKVQGDKWVVIRGDDAAGRYIELSGYESGASLQLDYQSFPSSMATLQDVCVCPHPEFVTKRAAGLILESRSDPRFPHIKADAQTLLDRMVEEEATPSRGRSNRTKDWARDINFRIGE